MKVKIEGVGEYFVKWHHRVPDDIVKDLDGLPVTSGVRATECLIFDNATGNLIEVAEARCNPSDHFERNRGRKISLTRALNKLFGDVLDGYPRLYRRAFWNAYRDQLGHY